MLRTKLHETKSACARRAKNIYAFIWELDFFISNGKCIPHVQKPINRGGSLRGGGAARREWEVCVIWKDDGRHSHLLRF